MAGSKSTWLSNVVLDSILGKNTTALSTGSSTSATHVGGTVWVGLWASSNIDDSFDAGSTGECAGSTYARVSVANTSANWTNSTAGSKQNKTEITFTSNAGADWGTVKAMAILNTSSTASGEILYWADLTANQTISSGNVVKFSTGAIVITED